MSARKPLPRPEEFAFWSDETVRVSDTDLNGHVNNGAIGAYCETGRADLMNAVASVLEVIDSVKRISGVDFTVLQAGRRAGDPASIIADGQALRRDLGWQPRHDSLDEMVRHALQWERKHSNLQPYLVQS